MKLSRNRLSHPSERRHPNWPAFGSMLFVLISGLLMYPSPSRADDDTIIRLREEIKVIEDRINDIEEGRRDVVAQLGENDRKRELRRRLIREMAARVKVSVKKVRAIEERIGDLDRQIADLDANLAVKQAELAPLRHDVGKRISFMYRRLHSNRLGILFGARGLNDLFQRKQYLQAIRRYDESQIKRLIESRNTVVKFRRAREKVYNELTLEQATRLSELERSRNLLDQQRAEERSLEREKADKSALLEQITGDSDLLMELLDERRRALNEIESEIKRIDRSARRMTPEYSSGIPFRELSGRLPWPVAGRKIAIPFGSIRHPDLGTVTINPGIDITAALGDPVSASAQGVVTRISYLRGFGNTVILSHGEGYYSVYSRLGIIMVKEGDIVETGRNIGMVGDTGSGEEFHFEIWANRKPQNPLKWLVNR